MTTRQATIINFFAYLFATLIIIFSYSIQIARNIQMLDPTFVAPSEFQAHEPPILWISAIIHILAAIGLVSLSIRLIKIAKVKDVLLGIIILLVACLIGFFLTGTILNSGILRF